MYNNIVYIYSRNEYIATFATVQATGLPDAITSNQALREANIGTLYTSIGYEQAYWTSGSEAGDYLCGRSNYSTSGAQALLYHVLKNMQSIKHFVDYPEEIIEYILFDIKSEADLLHLALTCKVLSSRIIPYHIQFRALHINLLERFPNRLPKLLNEHLLLRSCFRHAEILDHGEGPRLPWCLLPPRRKSSQMSKDISAMHKRQCEPAICTLQQVGPMSSVWSFTLNTKCYRAVSSVLKSLHIYFPNLYHLKVTLVYPLPNESIEFGSNSVSLQ
ncbi:hypothetical protein M422DRAFT_259200 [Sphaerobolus stellatus SS14]|uniref:F-box domain-containing protein n=1 Tax=Sphaerobolus stellatus (strain SS14) TaxID=990650 RepID=A0A0C9U5N0_SPHS4|nr:hypothetical protein M422DRAFT_259200 [Sphaerobolus stellatus SS14]